ATDATNLNKEENAILSVLKVYPTITQKELHEKTGISLGTIKRLLPKLQGKGVLERTGNRRSGKWIVIE
ncbi:MAG: winged helix-turn-helix transcriptional regulator, partial [Lachnospiraceae bacterium]|nr:winged helix-turn-helix transcriptional regulator [Lachnospiraceae bacterium]